MKDPPEGLFLRAWTLISQKDTFDVASLPKGLKSWPPLQKLPELVADFVGIAV